MTAVFIGIGNFFTWAFQLMPHLGNLPNLLFATLIIALLAYWVYRLQGFSKAHQQDDSYHE